LHSADTLRQAIGDGVGDKDVHCDVLQEGTLPLPTGMIEIWLQSVIPQTEGFRPELRANMKDGPAMQP
jgi:hypothetical protein